MSDNYKEEIENHAKEYFGDLHISMPEEMIGTTISLFEFHLSKEGLVDNDDYEAQRVFPWIDKIRYNLHILFFAQN